MNTAQTQHHRQPVKIAIRVFCILTILLIVLKAMTGCAYQSPGAKVSNTVNTSILPPAGSVAL